MDIKQIRDKIAACLYGGAMGDALGYAIEFDRWPKIQRIYGKNGITEFVLHDGVARISDDTQMTLFTAEGMALGCFHAAERGASARTGFYLYQAYLCWLETQGYPAESLWDPISRLKENPAMNHLRAPGNTCLSALRSGRMGTIEQPINNSKGCGGVMRTAPLGFVHSQHTGENPFGPALETGARAAAITHGHPLGWIPAGMLSDIVERCIYGTYPTLRAVVESSLAATVERFSEYECVSDFEALILKAVSLAERPRGEGCEIASVDEPAIRSLGEGWVGDEALAIAVYAALRYHDDLRMGLRAAVNHSGDSDSTGAIAGNILGAWLGMEALPQDWLGQIEMKEEIEALADNLQRVIEGGE